MRGNEGPERRAGTDNARHINTPRGEPADDGVFVFLRDGDLDLAAVQAAIHGAETRPPLDRLPWLRRWITDAVADLVLSIVFPAYGGAQATDQRGKGLNALVDLAVALRLYRFDHGRYPDALDELVPGYVDRVPLDFVNGKPLRYERRGEGVVVYSLGRDGEDDGGRHEFHEGDIAVELP